MPVNPRLRAATPAIIPAGRLGAEPARAASARTGGAGVTEATGTLFVAATPIGNLDDASPRLRSVLASVDIVAAEDTRHSQRLLAHFGLKKRLIAARA